MERKPKNETLGSEQKPPKNADDRSKVKPIANKLKDFVNNDKKDGVKKDSGVGHMSQISIADGKLFQPKEKFSSNLNTERKDEGKHKVSDVTNKPRSKMSTKDKNGFLKERETNVGKRDKKDAKTKAAEMEKDLDGEDFETPSKSFEDYLSYDLEAPKRKKRSCESKNPKRIKVDLKQNVKMRDSGTNSGTNVTEAPPTVVHLHSSYLYDS